MNEKDGSEQSPQHQPSLFAKMRTAGAVKAAERAEGGISSNAGVVYRYEMNVCIQMNVCITFCLCVCMYVYRYVYCFVCEGCRDMIAGGGI
jgi:hypothetical protein